MTLEEAINDKNRPLSVSPDEWMRYEQASDREDEEITASEAREVLSEERGEPVPDDEEVEPFDMLEIGVARLVIGCKMCIRALHQMDRMDAGKGERAAVSRIEDLVFNAVAPYVADTLKATRALREAE